MECVNRGNGHDNLVTAAARGRGVKRKLGAGDGLRLAQAAAVPGDPAGSVGLAPAPSHAPPHPFINNMDEIAYWIYTKRAPCLMNYDNLLKKQNDQAKSSKPKPKSVHSTVEETPSPKKKKKRKLSILDDELSPEEKQKNVYFDTTQVEKQNQKKALSSCESGSVYSNVDFNIKNSSIQGKTKKLKLQKNNKTLHKKNKVVTSTPKAPTTALRRSLRNAQHSLNNNSQLNTSYEALNCAINGHIIEKKENPKSAMKSKVSIDKKHLNGDHSIQKKNVTPTETPKKDTVLNGQFEDLSDVSGFTANYIRSTKLHSTRTPRNLRNKNNRNLVKESQQNLHKQDGAMIMCVNRSMNTTTEMQSPVILNTSTDSSQNVLNLVTMKDNGKSLGVNRSTSLLKFVDAKSSKTKESDLNKVDSSQVTRSNLNVTFQSKTSASSRYPKRHKLHTAEVVTETESQMNQSCKGTPDKRRRVMKNSTQFDDSDRKENPEEKIVTRTRSRNIALKGQQPNSVLVLSNVTEQVSSAGTMNVASPEDVQPKNISLKKKRRSVKYIGQAKKSVDKSGQSLQRDSLRDRSGFAACFSDSDNDSEPLKQRKFFC